MARTRATASKKRPKTATGGPPKRAQPGPVSVAIAKGDIVWIDYEGWILNADGTRSLFDTTREAIAKQEGKFDEKKVYAEFPIIVGQGRVLPGLDEALLTAELGKEFDLSIPPEKGAGDRDPKLVELHPLREFLRQEISPKVGMEMSLGGRRGTITQVTGGRVRMDFNNPLAGRTLSYRYRATRKATSLEERLRAVLEMDYGLPERFAITVNGNEAEVVVPDVCKTDERWFVSKFRVVADFRDLLDVQKVRFIEEYVKPAPAKETAKAEAPPEKAAPPMPPAPEPERAEEELPPEEKAPEEL